MPLNSKTYLPSDDHLPLRLSRGVHLAHLHAARVGLLVVAGGAALCGLGGCYQITASCTQTGSTGQAACLSIQGSTFSANAPITATIPLSIPTGTPSIPLAAQFNSAAVPAMSVNAP